jgi:hypothetical protein
MGDRARRVVLGAAVAAVLLLTGCATFGTFETAQTAAPGQFQFGGALTPAHIISSEGSNGTLFFPFPTLFSKVGVSERVDLGATWSFGPGVGVNGKYQFLSGPTDGALWLGGSYYGISVSGTGFGVYSIGPRLFLSSEREGSFPYMVNFGATYAGATASSGGNSASGGTLAALLGAGLPFRLGAGRDSRIMPELQVSIPVMSTYEAGEGSNTTALLEGFVASIGVCFGYVGPEHSAVRYW